MYLKIFSKIEVATNARKKLGENMQLKNGGLGERYQERLSEDTDHVRNTYECPFCHLMVADVTKHVDETPSCKRKRRRV